MVARMNLRLATLGQQPSRPLNRRCPQRMRRSLHRDCRRQHVHPPHEASPAFCAALARLQATTQQDRLRDALSMRQGHVDKALLNYSSAVTDVKQVGHIWGLQPSSGITRMQRDMPMVNFFHANNMRCCGVVRKQSGPAAALAASTLAFHACMPPPSPNNRSSLCCLRSAPWPLFARRRLLHGCVVQVYDVAKAWPSAHVIAE